MTEPSQADEVSDIMLDRYLADDLDPGARARVEAAIAQSQSLQLKLAERKGEARSYLEANPPEQFAHLLAAQLATEEAHEGWLARLMGGRWAMVPVGAVALVALYALSSNVIGDLAKEPLVVTSEAPAQAELIGDLPARRDTAAAPQPAARLVDAEDESSDFEDSKRADVSAPIAQQDEEASSQPMRAPEPREPEAVPAVAPMKATKAIAPPRRPSPKMGAVKKRRARMGGADSRKTSRQEEAAARADPVLEQHSGRSGAVAPMPQSMVAPEAGRAPQLQRFLSMTTRGGQPRPCALFGRREGTEAISWGPSKSQQRHPEAFLRLREDLRGGYWLVASKSDTGWLVLWPSGTAAAPGSASTAKLVGKAGSDTKVSVFWSASRFGAADLDKLNEIHLCTALDVRF